MVLKRLELQGYKTFASRQEFIFDQGITAIVGPNGSGKSNVADALRWVLGEQSYSTLRGKRTVDMIFAGSQARARAGMAQALLTLDNSGGWLPIDYSEVELGRRAYRSGENEYLINGQRVRLRDVAELLATSGLAERNYTIIGQGLIDRALSLRAEERRALFEEAAGINQYKLRRADSLRRLDETQRNLERVHDILSEIRPRLNALRRQAGRAQNYEQIEADLRHLLRIWYGHQWERARTRLRLRRQAATDAEAAWREGRQRLAAVEDRVEAEKRRIAGWQSQERARLRQRDEARANLEAARRAAAILAERSRLLDEQLAEVAAELPAAERRRATAEEELTAAGADLEAAGAALSQLQAGMATFSATFAAQQDEIQRWQQAITANDRAHREAQQSLAQMQGQLAQLKERLAERVEPPASPEDLADAIDRAGQAVESLRARRDEGQAARLAAAADKRELAERLKPLRREADQIGRALDEARQAIARQEARREILARLRPGAAAAADVAALGRLAALLEIPARQRRAIEAALRGRLAALIVPDRSALDALLANGEQALSAVALEDVPPPPPRPAVDGRLLLGWADRLVDYPGWLAPIAGWLLGTVACARDAESARALAASLPPGYLAVSPDGLIAFPGGLVERYPEDAADSPLTREAEWRAAVEELARRETERDRLAARAVERAEQIATLEAALERADQAEREQAAADATLAAELARSEGQWERWRAQARAAARQREQAETEQRRLMERAGKLEAEIAEAASRAHGHAAALAEARARLETLPVAEVQQERQNWQQQIEAARTILAGRQAVVDSRRATLNQADEQRTRLTARAAALRQERAGLDLPTVQAKAAAAEAALTEIDDALAPLRASLEATEESLRRLDAEGATARRAAHDAETEYTQARLDLGEQENQVSGLMDRIHADLGLVSLPYDDDETGQAPLPISEVVEQLPVVDELPADIEEEIQKYRAQLRRIGPINPDAPTEFAETEKRHDFLVRQVDDLRKTEHRLRAVIAELDQLTSTAFAETVERVDDVFGGMFRNLFGGGSARLVLTEPEDLTISGVDIVARLPSRREQGLALLSGGERSLTAAALIFALLKVAPTPFCVLDEVDAMLDEANVNRFTAALRDLSERTQFIVITHNRGTVQVAHTVYGISMGADSASRVLSVKPESYLADSRE